MIRRLLLGLILCPLLAGADPDSRRWMLEVIYLAPGGEVHGVDRLPVTEGQRCTEKTDAGLAAGARYGFELQRDARLGCWTSL